MYATRVNRWQKGRKEKKNVEYSIPIERNWLDSSFVARIGKKRRRVSPLARRGGSKAQATSERERRAGGGGGGRGEEGRKARGHREGLIFLIGRGRGTARWRVRAKNEPASSSFYRRPE